MNSPEKSEGLMSETDAANEAARMQEKMGIAAETGKEIDYNQAELLAEIDSSTNPRIESEKRPDYTSGYGLSPEAAPPMLHAEYECRAQEIASLPPEKQKDALKQLKDELYGANRLIKIGGGSYSHFESHWDTGLSPDIKESPEAELRALLGASKEALGIGFTVEGVGILKEIARRRGVEVSVVAQEQRAYLESVSQELVTRYKEAQEERKRVEERRKAGEETTSEEWNTPGGYSIEGLRQAIKVLTMYLPGWGLKDISDAITSETQISRY